MVAPQSVPTAVSPCLDPRGAPKAVPPVLPQWCPHGGVPTAVSPSPRDAAVSAGQDALRHLWVQPSGDAQLRLGHHRGPRSAWRRRQRPPLWGRAPRPTAAPTGTRPPWRPRKRRPADLWGTEGLATRGGGRGAVGWVALGWVVLGWVALGWVALGRAAAAPYLVTHCRRCRWPRGARSRRRRGRGRGC